jgi:hypothetical protein
MLLQVNFSDIPIFPSLNQAAMPEQEKEAGITKKQFQTVCCH